MTTKLAIIGVLGLRLNFRARSRKALSFQIITAFGEEKHCKYREQKRLRVPGILREFLSYSEAKHEKRRANLARLLKIS